MLLVVCESIVLFSVFHINFPESITCGSRELSVYLLWLFGSFTSSFLPEGYEEAANVCHLSIHPLWAIWPGGHTCLLGTHLVPGITPPRTCPPLELAEGSGMNSNRLKSEKLGGHQTSKLGEKPFSLINTSTWLSFRHHECSLLQEEARLHRSAERLCTWHPLLSLSRWQCSVPSFKSHLKLKTPDFTSML